MTGNAVPDYHNDSGSVNGIGRCGSSGYNEPTVEDGDADDAKGLINFIRGQDYFDYDGDCNLTENRSHYLADIYNSQVLVVGAPSGDTSALSENQEAYFRKEKNYDAFVSQNSARKKAIYAGANNGILHAFDADTGIEMWGFVPPLIASKLPTMINSGFNKTSGGGTVPIFGVDGSPVVHDVFMKKPGGTGKEWLSILMVPYGRGGAGFSVLDVTDPNDPKHLYSILNDRIRGYVYRSDHEGEIFPYSYGGRSFNINDFAEIVTVQNNYRNNSTIGDNCSQQASHACYRSNALTLSNVNNYSTASDVKIYVNGDDVTSTSSYSKEAYTNNLKITLPNIISYSADPSSSVINSTVNVSITNPIQAPGTEYDYRFLGETWSNPRILRLPNTGAGDTNIDDDLYVAVLGGGFSNNAGVGSNVFVINLENGKLIRQIDIPDLAGNGIANSVPSTPIVITPDLSLSADFRGALVYVNDLEGKITKINLTNMIDDRAQSGTPQQISMYDTNIIFSAESTKENGRYMYHSMEAAIGNDTKKLWLFTGTGDFRNLNDVGLVDKYQIDNIMLGIKDEYFPNYKNASVTLSANATSITTTTVDDLDQCENTSGDTTGANCPDNSKRGWYSLLDVQDGVPGFRTRPQRKVTGEPTISAGKVYFPIFKPSVLDPCAAGLAFICTADDECGTNNLSLIGTNNTQYANERCLYVGNGVLSKPIINSGIVYTAIAGESIIGNEDLVILPSIEPDINTFRIDWRETN